MIGMLTGLVQLVSDSYIILDVQGVGYKVLVSKQVLMKHQIIGEKVTLHIHTHVREDLIELYGFLTLMELQLFEQLINVSGVGCKTALGIFSTGSSSQIKQAIEQNDVAFFTQVPRLGKKNAQKIIIELKNKLGAVTGDEGFPFEQSNDQIVEALKHFGFSQQEAIQAIRAVSAQDATMEETLKLALKYLGK